MHPCPSIHESLWFLSWEWWSYLERALVRAATSVSSTPSGWWSHPARTHTCTQESPVWCLAHPQIQSLPPARFAPALDQIVIVNSWTREVFLVRSVVRSVRSELWINCDREREFVIQICCKHAFSRLFKFWFGLNVKKHIYSCCNIKIYVQPNKFYAFKLN